MREFERHVRVHAVFPYGFDKAHVFFYASCRVLGVLDVFAEVVYGGFYAALVKFFCGVYCVFLFFARYVAFGEIGEDTAHFSLSPLWGEGWVRGDLKRFFTNSFIMASSPGLCMSLMQ